MKSYTLNNGVTIPVLGFGTWKAENGEIAYQAVLEVKRRAIAMIRQRSIETKEALVVLSRYRNIPREEIFVTSKLWNTNHNYEQARQAFEESLAQLGLDYLDLI